MRHGYWGPCFDDGAIETALKPISCVIRAVPDPASRLRNCSRTGKFSMVSRRMEFGPRALGNRSILADPRDPEMNAKVNNAVKFREWWSRSRLRSKRRRRANTSRVRRTRRS